MRTSRRGIWLLAQPRSGASVRRSAHFFIRLKTESPLHESPRPGRMPRVASYFYENRRKTIKKGGKYEKNAKKA